MKTQAIAAEARAIIARKQLRQSQVAEALHLTTWQVSRRLSGAVDFSAAEIAELAEFTQVPVIEFFPDVNLAEVAGDAA